VLAHELSHVKNRDILVSSIAATLAGALSYLAQLAYYASAFGGRDRREGSPLGGLALVVLAPLVATLLHLAVSRSREYLADETGARTSGKAGALAAALQKIHGASRQLPLAATPAHEATAHLFFINPFRPSLLTALFSTHPPVEERIRRLLAAA
jgi:heat shock protein HtpX